MIDFHCHLDLYPNARQLADQVAARNRFTLVVTTSPRAWQATSRVFAGYDTIKVALGLHPEIVSEKASERELLISGVCQAEIIGEVGLDGSAQYRHTREQQESILGAVLSESERCGGKILSVHSRNAADPVLHLIERHCRISVPVLHWFSGTIEETRRAVAMGCWFSVGPAMLRGAKGRRILDELPIDRVLPETDGPFALNGSSPYMPWEAIAISSTVAGAWKMTEEEVRQQFLDNLSHLLGT
ncbi:MAG: TatD family hydrolase [Gemmatimonadota bacterium]|nr:TatD family hydrolase [Bacteroidota bacterium]MDE2736052.1 TatD family hydrolase [Gemmatimonadota bacterium]